MVTVDALSSVGRFPPLSSIVPEFVVVLYGGGCGTRAHASMESERWRRSRRPVSLAWMASSLASPGSRYSSPIAALSLPRSLTRSWTVAVEKVQGDKFDFICSARCSALLVPFGFCRLLQRASPALFPDWARVVGQSRVSYGTGHGCGEQ